MTSVTFKDILDSVYNRVDDLDVITPCLGEVEPRLELAEVQSCVAVGAGYGRLDLAFLEHCMPNVGEFTAVEPDPNCAAELRARLAAALPNARSVVSEETVQSWPGVDRSVDAVLLVHFLYYLNSGERLALYRRLRDSVLRSGGFLIILIHPHHTSGAPSAYCRVIQLLKSSEESDELVTDREVRVAMSVVGFELCYERTFNSYLSVADMDDTFLSLFLRPGGSWSLESVRQAADRVFGNSKKVRHDSWLGIFRKP